MKRFTALMLTSLMALMLISCSPQPTNIGTEENATEVSAETTEDPVASAEKTTLTVGVPKAPPALPVLYMMENKVLGENVEIKLDIWSDPETLIAMVQDKEHDMFAFPVTVVSTLYNKGVDVRLMNVNTWGVNYFLTSDPAVNSWADLRGKTLYVPLQSSPLDVLTQYFLKDGGLTVGEDVEIIYASTSEVATLLGDGKAQYGSLIEPMVTMAMMKNDQLRIPFIFEQEWQRVTQTDTKIPTAGWGTTQAFIDQNSELCRTFQSEYAKACQWINQNPEKAGLLAEKYLELKAPMIQKSIPKMGLEFKTAQQAKEELAMFYQLLYDFNPKMIGGKIADEELYYKE